MTSRVTSRFRLIAPGAALTLLLLAGTSGTSAQDVGTEAQRNSGKALYSKYCSQCHGDKGDGEGYATPHLFPKPRNFTSGKFKVRTTPNGALPTHQDLVNIIRRGMPYTSMPAWPNLSDQQVTDLAYYITTFSPNFSDKGNVPKPIDLPSAPGSSDQTIAAGKKLYEDTGCVRCHGTLGRGDGQSAPTLKDDFDHPIRAADLAQPWTFRGGGSRADIFRTMSTGFNGTPMPSFSDSLTPEQRWAITDFIVSLSGRGDNEGPGYTNLVRARHVQNKIDLAKGAENFADAPVARFPIVGQIMEPGRAFHPSATSVMVQAIYDAESIAVLVRWHDMSAQKTGTNEPTLPVPVEEEEETSAPAAGSADNPFGDQTVAAPAAGQAAAGQAQPAQPADPFAEAPAEAPGAASEFSDAVMVQLPSLPQTGARKPYFIFGDGEYPADLWFFDLAKPEPLRFTGKGSASIAPNDLAGLTGVAKYDQGEWSVIFKRPLRVESAATFPAGEFIPIAFSVWDGFARERGNKRGLTLWYSLYVEPAVVPSAAGPMVRTALIVLGLELAIIWWVRSRQRARALSGGFDVQEHLRSSR
jgi:mono/diheme cytochrome c family protein